MPTEGVVAIRGKWLLRFRRALNDLREAWDRFYSEDSFTLAASIAYYSVLSIFPLLLLVLGLGGIYIRHYQLEGRLAPLLERILPMRPDFILQNLQGISRAYGRIGVASFVLLLWSSAGVFMPIEKSLNRAWGVQEERAWMRRRLVALEMVLIFAFLILVSSAFVGVNLSLGRSRDWLPKWVLYQSRPLIVLGSRLLLSLASFGMTLAGFIVLFERLPNRPMRLRQVFPSAFLTAILWQGARVVFTFLLTRFNYRHVYGSIGAMVSFMTWAYFSSAVMLYGARVSYALHRTVEEPIPCSGSPPV
jgi:YihY family inner membrane protein